MPRGLNRMMEMVNDSRFGVAMMGLGIARRSFLEAVDLGAPPAGAGPAPRRSPARARTARRPPGRARGRGRARLRVRARVTRRDDGDRLRRILVPRPRRDSAASAWRPSRATVELYGGNGYCEDWGLPAAARRAVPSDLGGQREHLRPRRLARDATRCRHEAVLARIDDGLAIAVAEDAPHTESPGRAVHARRHARPAHRRVLGRERDESEARSAALTAALVHTVSAAFLLERSAGDARKGLVVLRYAAPALLPGAQWDDHIAANAAARCSPTRRSTLRPAAKAAA